MNPIQYISGNLQSLDMVIKISYQQTSDNDRIIQSLNKSNNSSYKLTAGGWCPYVVNLMNFPLSTCVISFLINFAIVICWYEFVLKLLITERKQLNKFRCRSSQIAFHIHWIPELEGQENNNRFTAHQYRERTLLRKEKDDCVGSYANFSNKLLELEPG